MSTRLALRPGSGISWPVAAVLAMLAAAPRPALARHHRGHDSDAAASKPASHAAKEIPQVEAAQQALTAGDAAGAYRILEEAYRARPVPALLFWLGRVAVAENRAMAAQDYMRRFLIESGADKDEAAAALRSEAQKLADQPTDAGAEARMSGPKGGLLFVDDRLAGTLPFPGPMLLAAGSHRVAIETKRKRLDGKVDIVAGRGVEVLFDLDASAVLVSQQPVVLVLRFDRGVAPADQPKLGNAIRDAFTKSRCSPAQAADALRIAPDFRGCLRELGCQLRLAEKSAQDYALRLDVDSKAASDPSRRDVTISAAILDVAVGAVAAELSRTCSACALDAVAGALGAVVGEALERGLGRPRGAIQVETTPPGAAVTIDGRLVGQSPLKRDVLAGSHTVALSASGQKSVTQTVRVDPSQTWKVKVALEKEATEAEPPPPSLVPTLATRFFYPRPRWRLIAGGVAVGAGLILTGFGSSALAVNGQCQTPAMLPMTSCGYLLSTGGVGGGLLGAGLVISLGGAGLMLWPGPGPGPGPRLGPNPSPSPGPELLH